MRPARKTKDDTIPQKGTGIGAKLHVFHRTDIESSVLSASGSQGFLILPESAHRVGDEAVCNG